MEFVNPGFLYGLLAISIPVIIHLFNFRRFKKIYFSNVSFIRELKLQTQKQSKIKHLLILLMRVLAIAAIVLAFAQPYFPVRENISQADEKNAVSIYIDNSFSMMAGSENGTLLDEAKQRARDICSVYKSSDVFQLLTNDFEGKHQRFVSRDEFLDFIEEIHVSPVVKSLAEITSRQKVLFEGNDQTGRTAYIISDFQKSIFLNGLPSLDSTINILLVHLEGINKDNIFIDSCWFDTPVHQMNGNEKLNVKIRNSSDRDFEKIPVKLMVNGRQKAIASFDLQENGSAEVVLSFTNYEPGIQSAVLEINDFTITFDDQLWFSYYISGSTSILCINGSGENIYLNSLFMGDSLFRFVNVNEGRTGYADFTGYQFIILNELETISTGLIQQLVPFVNNGGSLMVLPAGSPDGQRYSDLLRELNVGSYGMIDTTKTRISFINLEHPLYANVFDEIPENIDLPVVLKHFPVKSGTRSRQEALLEMQSKGSFLNVFQAGKGKVYLSSVPFMDEFSSFQRHAIFVPTLFKIAISSNIDEELYYIIGDDEVINIGNRELDNDEVFRIKMLSSEFEVIPEHRRYNFSIDIFTRGQINKAGNFVLSKGDQAIRGVSFNYSREESEMVFYTPVMLAEYVSQNKLNNIRIITPGGKPFVQTLSEFNQGTRLWKLFIILALIFLLAESLLLRFLK